MFSIMFPFPGYVFRLCFWVVYDVRLGVRKNIIYAKCKGILKNTIKRKIKYNNFYKVLKTNEIIP